MRGPQVCASWYEATLRLAASTRVVQPRGLRFDAQFFRRPCPVFPRLSPCLGGQLGVVARVENRLIELIHCGVALYHCAIGVAGDDGSDHAIDREQRFFNFADTSVAAHVDDWDFERACSDVAQVTGPKKTRYVGERESKDHPREKNGAADLPPSSVRRAVNVGRLADRVDAEVEEHAKPNASHD